MNTSKFTRIKEGFSTIRRLPRLNKIRLGIKVKNAQGKEYPKETPHFVVPPEVAEQYGETPTELDVMLPLENEEVCFVQKLAYYGSSKGLQCHGNGETAERKNDKGEWEPRSCPCELRKTKENPQGQCSELGHLMVLLPKVSLGGVYQITTSSYNSVVDLNSSIDYIRALVGRIAMVPLKLRRVPTQTNHDGKRQTHYTLALVLDADVNGVNQLRFDSTRVLQTARGNIQIEGPAEENPRLDAVDVVATQDEAVEQADATPSAPAEETATLTEDEVKQLQAEAELLSEQMLKATAAGGPKQFNALRKEFACKTKFPLEPSELQNFVQAMKAWSGWEHAQ